LLIYASYRSCLLLWLRSKQLK